MHKTCAHEHTSTHIANTMPALYYDVYTSGKAGTILWHFPPCPCAKNTIPGLVLGKKISILQVFIKYQFKLSLRHFCTGLGSEGRCVCLWAGGGGGQVSLEWPHTSPAPLLMACLIKSLVLSTTYCFEQFKAWGPWCLQHPHKHTDGSNSGFHGCFENYAAIPDILIRDKHKLICEFSHLLNGFCKTGLHLCKSHLKGACSPRSGTNVGELTTSLMSWMACKRETVFQ